MCKCKHYGGCVKFLWIVLLIVLVSCRTPTVSPTVSIVPTPQETLSIESVSPLATPELSIPAPQEGMATIYGTLLNADGDPLASMPVYLGKFDGFLVEISMNYSPRTISDDFGNFMFENIPPNDATFQYVIGVIWADSGVIIKSPGSDNIFVFNVLTDEIIDLGALRSDI